MRILTAIRRHRSRRNLKFFSFISTVPIKNIQKSTITFVTMAPCDVPPGVVTGENLVKLLTHARENGYAIPAFNCTR
jgi:hypothetical protein